MILRCGLVAACLTVSATADFTGWAANVSQVGDYGVMDVYAMFANGGRRDMTAVLDLDLDPIGFAVFHHDNFVEPAWAPQVSFSADWVDSYLTIGYHAPPLSNPTTPLGSFGNWYGPASVLPPLAAPGSHTGPGWINSQSVLAPVFPVAVSLNLNDTGSDWGVLVGRFAILNPADGTRRAFRFNASAAWGAGVQITRDVETFAYIPSPGALAVFGLTCFVGPRRRN